MTRDVVSSRVVPLLVDICNDTVANVRLNVAKAFTFLKDTFSSDTIENIVKPILENYLKDGDRDVRYFAQVGLNALKC